MPDTAPPDPAPREGDEFADLDRVEELDRLATPGPWSVERRHSNGCEIIPRITCARDDDRGCGWIADTIGAPYLGHKSTLPNAALIAEYRTLAPKLARHVRRQADRIAELTRERDHAEQQQYPVENNRICELEADVARLTAELAAEIDGSEVRRELEGQIVVLAADAQRLTAGRVDVLRGIRAARVELAALVADPSDPDFAPAVPREADEACVANAYAILTQILTPPP